MIIDILKKLISQQDLNTEEAKKAMACIMTGEAGDVKTASFLTAMAIKGETGIEIEACANAMRHAAVTWPGKSYDVLVDTCGTGGDSSGTINISTMSAILLASMKVPVAKHGNRAVSSTTGSADILESLGMLLNLNHEDIANNLEKYGMTFLFAPMWHPAMKYAAPVRKSLGFRTVFNILGPLTNPAPITHQMLGVFDKSLMEPVAIALAKQGRKGALVIHSEDGLDEISPSGHTHFIRVEDGEIKLSGSIHPADFGFEEMSVKGLVVADRNDSLQKMNKILDGKGSDTQNKTIAMNAALIYDMVLNKNDLKESAQLCLTAIKNANMRSFINSWT